MLAKLLGTLQGLTTDVLSGRWCEPVIPLVDFNHPPAKVFFLLGLVSKNASLLYTVFFSKAVMKQQGVPNNKPLQSRELGTFTQELGTFTLLHICSVPSASLDFLLVCIYRISCAFSSPATIPGVEQKYLTASFCCFACLMSPCPLTLDSASSSMVVYRSLPWHSVTFQSVCPSSSFLLSALGKPPYYDQLARLYINTVHLIPLCCCLVLCLFGNSTCVHVCHNDRHCCASHCLHKFVAYKHSFIMI